MEIRIEQTARRTRVVALSMAIIIAVAISLAMMPASTAAAAVPTAQAPFLQPDDSVVTADPLPTVQIDSGYVWAQTTIGNTVYAAGSFSNARAALAEPGTNLTARSNILAFDITTGALLPFAPQVNGVIKSIAASPDGSRIYIGGSFNQVNGQARWGIAALDAKTGALVSGFAPSVGGTGVFGLAVTADTVYVGGSFTQANGVARTNLAAFATSNGALKAWAPTTDQQVDALVVEPGAQHIIAGGRFYSTNGVVQRGLAAIDPASGALDTGWLAPQTVKNGWSTGSSAGKAGIFSLATDATGVYGTGWVYAEASVGNLEGTFAADAGTGAIRWVADCHGDHYGVYSTGETVYATSHTHACETVNLWPEQTQRSYRYIEAYTTTAEGTLTRSASAGSLYADWSGTPSPSAYAWYPDFTVGTASGLGQAGLSITGSGDYIAVAGEFTSVNNQRYQGIVRFSTNPGSGAKQGPRLSGTTWVPTATSAAPQRISVTVPLNWSRDDRDLTYQLIRSGSATPVDEVVAASGWWSTSTVTLSDTGLTGGSSYTYSVRAVDADGNAATSQSVSATATAGTTSDYANLILDDRAQLYYPLGAIKADWAGTNTPVFGSGASTSNSGAVAGATGTSSTLLSGTSSGRVASSKTLTADNDYAVELWFKTTTTRGGKLVGFGNTSSGSSSQYDRHVYMQNNGRLTFGVYPGAASTISTTSAYNDGSWHHVVATQNAEGTKLFIDGVLAASDTAVTGGDIYTGYWRIGGDSLSGWPNSPTSNYFSGTIDEVAVYPTAITAAQVSQHYATGRGLVAPTADFTSTSTDLAVSVDAAASVAAQGQTIASYAWAFGDGATATGVTASHAYSTPGTYDVTLTVRDGQGLTSVKATSVTVHAPNVLPVAAFEVTASGMSVAVNALASADSDGTIAEYRWDWGDGSEPGVGATATHAYQAAGSYTVTLTVVDDRGGEATIAHQTEAVHADPSASFLAAASTLTVAVDASASTASDAAALEYEWEWGDDSALGTGKTASHTYASAGDYTITLTITDSLGGTASTTRTVSVADIAYAIRDDFERSLNSGWGSAETGGVYTALYGSASAASVSGGSGLLTLPAGQTRNMALQGTALADSLTTVTFSLAQAPSTGGSYVGVAARQSASGDYLTRVWLRTDGTLWLVIQRSGTVIATQSLSTTWAAGDKINLSVKVSGSGSTTIQAKTWKSGGAEPSNWQITTTDSTAALQGSGWISLHAARGGAATSTGVFAFDGLRVIDQSQPVAPTNADPVASFTSSVADLVVSVNAAGSSDPDGTIASYAWDWGDGSAAGSGVTATHEYAAAGTYTVKLTVKDNDGASASKTAQVIVTSAPADPDPTNADPVASFTSSVADLVVSVDAAGSSDPDGTIASYAWDWGDGSAAGSGVTANHEYEDAGTYSVTLTLTDDDGATASKTVQVAIAGAPVEPAFVASDDFARTVASGWGSADIGGAWNVLYGSASAASVTDGVGRVTLAASDTRNLMLNSVSVHDVEMSVDFALDAAPASGSSYVGVVARSSGTDNYTVRSWLNSNGSVWIVIQRGSTVLKTYTVPGITRAADDAFTLKVEITGTASTTINAKLWRAGAAEPTAWQVSAVDAAGLDASGAVGVHTNRSSLATSTGIVTIDGFRVTDLD